MKRFAFINILISNQNKIGTLDANTLS